MIPLLGAIGVGGLICLLFLARPRSCSGFEGHMDSYAWLLIACSRPVSAWLTFQVPGTATDEYIDGSPLDRNVLIFLLVLALYVLSKRTRQVRAIIVANPQIVLYFSYCLISLLWSDYPFVVFKRWIRSLGDVSMMLVIITERDWVDALKWVLTRLSFILVPLSILFIRFYPALGRAYSRGGSRCGPASGPTKMLLA